MVGNGAAPEPQDSVQLLFDMDRRVVRLETAMDQHGVLLEKIARTQDEQRKEKPPYGHYISAAGIAVVVIIALAGGLWRPVAADLARLSDAQLRIMTTLDEKTSDRWTRTDMKAYDKDMTEWQRRQDDQILDLWRNLYRVSEAEAARGIGQDYPEERQRGSK